jgi:hypothetical protein
MINSINLFFTILFVLQVLVLQAEELPRVVSLFKTNVTAQGELLYLEGKVLDQSGAILPGASIEIWQTDTKGIYNHPGDPKTDNRDKGFQFFGTSEVTSDGYYRFRTVMPGKYEPRPRHIHVKVRYRNREVLTTQVYFSVDGETRGAGGSNKNLRIALQKFMNVDGKNYYYGYYDIVLENKAGGKLKATDSQSEGPYYPQADVSEYDNDLAHVN